MVFSLYNTKAQIDYSGPNDFKLHADILPFIGEVAISFSWLERRVTWAIESMLGTTIKEADETESFVQNFSARIKFFEMVGRPLARENASEHEFASIVQSIRDANGARNKIIHNSFVGVAMTPANNGEYTVSAVKNRYNPKPEKAQYLLSTADLRQKAEENLAVCQKIQNWILRVRPNAHNRVP